MWLQACDTVRSLLSIVFRRDLQKKEGSGTSKLNKYYTHRNIQVRPQNYH